MASEHTRDIESNRRRLIRHLREFIAALDRRVPHIEREGEIQIATDAAALKEKALTRLIELTKHGDSSTEGEPPPKR